MRVRFVKKNDVLIVEQKQEDFIILVVILRIVQQVMGKCCFIKYAKTGGLTADKGNPSVSVPIKRGAV